MVVVVVVVMRSSGVFVADSLLSPSVVSALSAFSGAGTALRCLQPEALHCVSRWRGGGSHRLERSPSLIGRPPAPQATPAQPFQRPPCDCELRPVKLNWEPWRIHSARAREGRRLTTGGGTKAWRDEAQREDGRREGWAEGTEGRPLTVPPRIPSSLRLCHRPSLPRIPQPQQASLIVPPFDSTT